MNADDRPFPPSTGDEWPMLVGFLAHHRATLRWKCSGLDQAGLSQSAAATTMTLGGLLKHMAYVEDHWCLYWVAGEDRPEPWASVDWSADIDWDWNSARHDEPADLFSIWQASVDRSQAALDAAMASRGLEGLAVRTGSDGESPSLRWVMVHLIEEYARHNGHADLLREAVDGATGE